MSAVRSRSLGSFGLDALALAVVFAIAWAGVRGAPALHGDAALIGALGFLLLAGSLTSKVIEVLGVPHLTGYLLAGVVAGPHVLHLVDHDAVTRLQPVNTLALALIALAGGAEIELGAIRRSLRSLAVAMIVQCGSVLAVVALVFVVAAPTLIPFTYSLRFSGVVGVALLWGVIAVSRSPAATLAVVSQTRAKGPLTSFSLAFVMTSDVVVVVLLAAMMAIAKPLVDPAANLSLAAFHVLGHEILGSVAIGTTLGVVLALYLKLVGRQLIVVLVALGFGATETLHYLNYEPLLTFLVAGFVVRNLSQQGEKFLHATEQMGGVVYVVFFANAGAHLDLPLLKELWPVALLLAGSRAFTTIVAAKVSSRIAGDAPTIKSWSWAPLVSQAGLTLGLSAVIAREFPSFGAGFRALAIATVALNEIVGPIVFKLALDRAKETSGPGPELRVVTHAPPQALREDEAA
ncbi:Trk system potassium uptake protein TrkA [Labilithrix luteola]|uniref:Trk system potassium uptake protein TrkA n=1 Tax=Labilithrix luteola TaxID=1391654 RepID=A0A0K1Q418_9BACT|nr:cation:proton antiporter [Labilithrix luteola]AKV00576.1 Trk system potassium uptake protein TrkA [Labilithrix luteola]